MRVKIDNKKIKMGRKEISIKDLKKFLFVYTRYNNTNEKEFDIYFRTNAIEVIPRR